MHTLGLERSQKPRGDREGEECADNRRLWGWVECICHACMSICTQPITVVALQLCTSCTRRRQVARGATEGASPFGRTRQKKTSNFRCSSSNLVRTKGLEPPRLSASDPKSDVATNYTMSAGSRTPVNQRVCSMFLSSSGAKVKTFCNIHNIITLFRIIFSIFVS